MLTNLQDQAAIQRDYKCQVVSNEGNMGYTVWSSECLLVLLGILYSCSLLQISECASNNNNNNDSNNKQLRIQSNFRTANVSYITSSKQLPYRRHRRKLPNETNDQQLNSLDDTGLQYQEYQGVFGKPGVDFPVLSHIPVTKFNCKDVKNSNTGYYADLDTNCQVFHVCDSGRKVSFLCPNGTIFRQSHLICDWWFKVDCERSPELYDQSVQQLKADQNLYKQRAEAISNAMHGAFSKGVTDSMLLQSPVSVMNKPESSNLQNDGFKVSNLNYPSTVSGFSPSSSQFTSPSNSILQDSVSQIRPSQNMESLPFTSQQQSNFNTVPPQIYQQSHNNINYVGNSQSGFDQPKNTATSQFLSSSSWNTQTNGIPTYSPETTYSQAVNLPTSAANPVPSSRNIFNVDSKNKKIKFNSFSQFKNQNLDSIPTTTTFPRSTVSPTLPPFTKPINNQRLTQGTTAAPFNDSDYHKESQVPAETAAFSGSGKFSDIQDYYYKQNYINQQNYKNSETLSQQSLVPQTTSSNLTPYNLQQTFSNNSFALYYPSNNNFEDSTSHNPSISEFSLNVSPTFGLGSTEVPSPETIPVLLTNQTKEGYNQLFFSTSESIIPSTTPAVKSSDLLTEFSSGLVQSSSPKSNLAQTINERLKVKSSPNYRELAQIFSRALSAYLEDPEQFRKILSEVRPTEPPSTNSLKEFDEEVLNFSDDEGNTQRENVVTSSTTNQSIRDPETFAEEINNFMFDPFLGGHTDSVEFNVNETYYPTSISINQSQSIAFTASPMIDYIGNATKFGTTPSLLTPPKLSLYDDKGETKFSDSNAQVLHDEPGLQTSDSQSFLSRDNLLRYKNSHQFFNAQPPNLKSPAYPQFGMRTTASYISSRSDYITPRTAVPKSSTYATTAYDQFLRTTLNMISPESLKPVFNETTVSAMVNMMQEAKTNTDLRNKLVLLLVNDKSNPSETKSVKEMKSKLLRALVVPQSTIVYDSSFTQHPINRRKVRKESRRVHQVFSTTPHYIPAEDSETIEAVTRSGRSTPSQKAESDRLSDQDARAVDLLKTLYSIASNFWNQ